MFSRYTFFINNKRLLVITTQFDDQGKNNCNIKTTN